MTRSAAGSPLPRLVEPLVDELFSQLPALMLVGPRAAGKTTLASTRVQDELRLDRPGVAAAVRLDPDAALAGTTEPLLIDEWQEVPSILGAVKRAVDSDPRPGRFLLTGSAQIPPGTATWPATGRIVAVPVWGMTPAEQKGAGDRGDRFDVLIAPEAEIRLPDAPLDLGDYVRLALRGGFPEPALRLDGLARSAWLESYLAHVVERDIAAGEARDPVRVRHYLQALALNTAGVTTLATLLEAGQVNRLTAEAYESAFERLYLLDRVRAWHSNRLARLVKLPKRYLTDAALAAAALGVDERTAMRDADLLGRLLDTFVASQVRTLASLQVPRPVLHHLRDRDGQREIDLVIELPQGRVVGIEIKAASEVSVGDTRHLRWLRDQLGEKFVLGVVLHTGPLAIDMDDRIRALPISALWAG